jgi:hypothetical protein
MLGCVLDTETSLLWGFTLSRFIPSSERHWLKSSVDRPGTPICGVAHIAIFLPNRALVGENALDILSENFAGAQRESKPSNTSSIGRPQAARVRFALRQVVPTQRTSTYQHGSRLEGLVVLTAQRICWKK